MLLLLFFLFCSDLSSLNFHRCPTAYCCSSTKCNSYNQCATNRYGRLCSRSVPFANVFTALHMATQSWALWFIHTARDGTGTGTGKRWVSVWRYVLYTIHRDRGRYMEPLFYIVPIPFPVPVPLPLPCSV